MCAFGSHRTICMAFDVQSPPVCETSLEQLEDRFRSLINRVAKLQRTAGDASRRCGGEKTVKCGAESSGDLAHVNEGCLCLQHFAAAALHVATARRFGHREPREQVEEQVEQCKRFGLQLFVSFDLCDDCSGHHVSGIRALCKAHVD